MTPASDRANGIARSSARSMRASMGGLGMSSIALAFICSRVSEPTKYTRITVDREIFVVKFFRRRSFLTKIKHAKYFA